MLALFDKDKVESTVEERTDNLSTLEKEIAEHKRCPHCYSLEVKYDGKLHCKECATRKELFSQGKQYKVYNGPFKKIPKVKPIKIKSPPRRSLSEEVPVAEAIEDMKGYYTVRGNKVFGVRGELSLVNGKHYFTYAGEHRYTLIKKNGVIVKALRTPNPKYKKRDTSQINNVLNTLEYHGWIFRGNAFVNKDTNTVKKAEVLKGCSRAVFKVGGKKIVATYKNGEVTHVFMRSKP